MDEATNAMKLSSDAILILQILLLVVGWAIKRTVSTVEKKQQTMDVTQKEILVAVNATNGRVIKLEQHSLDHDKRDDERFQDMKDRIEKMRDVA